MYKADITARLLNRIVLLHAKAYESAKQLINKSNLVSKIFRLKVELDNYINYFKICYNRQNK